MKSPAHARPEESASVAVRVGSVGSESSVGEGAAASGRGTEDSETGIETEREDPEQDHVEQPFDPSRIKVRTVPVVVDQIVTRIEHDEIDLAPDFQRMRGIWDLQRRSRLIESLLLRIPIPVFYVAADHDDNWAVVDGVQRISTIHDYMTGVFALTHLEYRREFDGKRYDQLPRSMQRRIIETQIVVNVIEPGTPPEIMFNIFRRINTGGMMLNGQEIRHALNPGPVRAYLKMLAESEEFLDATDRSIRPPRMADRECVLRFLAFHIEPWEGYASGSLDSHLQRTMKTLNVAPSERLDALAADFRNAMRAAARRLRQRRVPQALPLARRPPSNQPDVVRSVGRAGEGRTALGGDMPINPSGGLLAKGHPVGATGLSQLFEAVHQLRGDHPNQVRDARFGLTHNLGGTGVACTVSILGRPDA